MQPNGMSSISYLFLIQKILSVFVHWLLYIQARSIANASFSDKISSIENSWSELFNKPMF